MIARSAPSPSSPAPSARRYAALGLDGSTRPSKPRPTVPPMCFNTVPKLTAGQRPTGRVLVFSFLIAWNRSNEQARVIALAMSILKPASA
jgi:hypothetical protein